MMKTAKVKVTLNFDEICMVQSALDFFIYHNEDDLSEDAGTNLMDLGEKLLLATHNIRK